MTCPAFKSRSALAGGLALALGSALLATPASAQKEPAVIRQHVMEQVAVSSDPFHTEALDALIDTTVWEVAIEQYGSGGESLLFMAVHEGEVLRLRRQGANGTRENFVRLLPDDFRIGSEADARTLIAAAMSLHTDFSEPETPLDEMRVETREGAYLFVDGERFGDATGYRIDHDAEGRVTGFAYSWELDAEPLEDAG